MSRDYNGRRAKARRRKDGEKLDAYIKEYKHENQKQLKAKAWEAKRKRKTKRD